MRDVDIKLLFYKEWDLKRVCHENNLAEFLQRIFADNILIYDYRIESLFSVSVYQRAIWVVLDSKFNILTLDNEVPNKIMIACLDMNVLTNFMFDNVLDDFVLDLNQFILEEHGIEIFPEEEAMLITKPIRLNKDKESKKKTVINLLKQSFVKIDRKLIKPVKEPVFKESLRQKKTAVKPQLNPMPDIKPIPKPPVKNESISVQKPVQVRDTFKKVSRPKIVPVVNKLPVKSKLVIKEPVVEMVSKPVQVKKESIVSTVKNNPFKKQQRPKVVRESKITSIKEIKPEPMVIKTESQIKAKTSEPVSYKKEVKAEVKDISSGEAVVKLDVKPKAAHVVVKLNPNGTSKVVTMFEPGKTEIKKSTPEVKRTQSEPVKAAVNTVKPQSTIKVEKPVEPIKKQDTVSKKEVKPVVVKEQPKVVPDITDSVKVKPTTQVPIKEPHVPEPKKDEPKVVKVVSPDTLQKPVKKEQPKTQSSGVENKEPLKQEPVKKEQTLVQEPIKKQEPLKQEPVKKEEPKQEEKQPEIQEMSYTVVSPEGEVLFTKSVKNQQPMTVEQILLQSGLSIDNSQGFIEGINGLRNQGMSGWVFEVNNAPVMVSAAEYVVNPTDQITWKYVDFSKMMTPEEPVEEQVIKQEEPVKVLKKEKVAA